MHWHAAFLLCILLVNSCGSAQVPPADDPCEPFKLLKDSASTRTEYELYELTTERLLIEASDTVAYHQFRQCYLLHAVPEDSLTRQAVNFTHHYQLARYGLIHGQDNLANIHLARAYQLNPAHLPLQELLRDHIFQQAQVLLADNELARLGKLLRQTATDYPFFLADKDFLELLVFTKETPE